MKFQVLVNGVFQEELQAAGLREAKNLARTVVAAEAPREGGTFAVAVVGEDGSRIEFPETLPPHPELRAKP